MVSRLCEIIDLKILPKKDRLEWTVEDVDEAFRMILKENNPNFDALIKNIENNPELDELTQQIILDGTNISFVRTDNVISLGIIYGIFAEQDGLCVIHNRIYESLIYDHLMMKTARSARSISDYNLKGNFIVGQKLDMERVLLKFQEFMKERYSGRDTGFIEREGRLLFFAKDCIIKTAVVLGTGTAVREFLYIDQVNKEKRCLKKFFRIEPTIF